MWDQAWCKSLDIRDTITPAEWNKRTGTVVTKPGLASGWTFSDELPVAGHDKKKKKKNWCYLFWMCLLLDATESHTMGLNVQCTSKGWKKNGRQKNNVPSLPSLASASPLITACSCILYPFLMALRSAAFKKGVALLKKKKKLKGYREQVRRH